MDDIQQATVCGIAYCPNGRNYWLIGQPQPKQLDSILGSLWLAVSTLDWDVSRNWDLNDSQQIYEHPCNVWLPIGTVIEFREHKPINIKSK